MGQQWTTRTSLLEVTTTFEQVIQRDCPGHRAAMRRPSKPCYNGYRAAMRECGTVYVVSIHIIYGGEQMEITHRTTADVHILELSGRFDAHEVPIVARWFDTHPQTRTVIVNMHGVSFIDTSGLATLVKGLKHCRQNGGELSLCQLQQAVKIIFELTRLDTAFPIFTDEQSARNAIM